MKAPQWQLLMESKSAFLPSHLRNISSHIFFHLFQVLNFDSPRGGISLETEKSRTGTQSKLLVTRATVSDNGNYTCLPSRGEPVSADVHVITGLKSIHSILVLSSYS